MAKKKSSKRKSSKKTPHKKSSSNSKSVNKADFETFKFGVERLKELKKELNSLDTKGFSLEEESIKSKLKDVTQIPTIEKELKLLKQKIKNKPKKSSKKKSSKKSSHKKTSKKFTSHKKSKKITKADKEKAPTLKLKTDEDIARDFAVKISQKFNKIVKSIVLFGSTIKKDKVSGSDIDVMILIDDASIKWDQELIAWYREELEKILRANPYNKELHVNTVKLSTWWEDLMRGDPVVINVLRYGEAMVDLAGFFNPLKHLLIQGKIKATPEAIHSCLQRAPLHLTRSKAAELGAVEGLYWSMVDSAHAALIAANVLPPSPEHISEELKKTFVSRGKLNSKYPKWFGELLELHKKIEHREISDLKGVEIDDWQKKTEDFMMVMTKLVDEMVS